jgi:hypothetical protein
MTLSIISYNKNVLTTSFSRIEGATGKVYKLYIK